MRLSLKELLNVSSDWKQINNLKAGEGGAPSGNALSIEFQNKQIERIVEAIGLTLPAGGALNASMLGGLASGNTLSTANLDVPGTHDYGHQNKHSHIGISGMGGSPQMSTTPRYEDQNVRDLAYDIGVDHKLLKQQLQSLVTQKF